MELRLAAFFLILLIITSTNNAIAALWNEPQLNSGAYFETSSTTESNGFRCGNFSSTGTESSCSGSALYTDSTGDGSTFNVIDYSSRGSAEFGTLRTESSLTYFPNIDTNLFPGGADVRDLPSFGTAHASAGFRDTWTITGGLEGGHGTIMFSYHLDGISESPSINGVSVSSSTSIGVAEVGIIDVLPTGTKIIGVIQSGTGYNSGFNGLVDEVVELELGFTFGEAFTLQVSMVSSSNFNFIDELTPTFFTRTDFFNTALLENIQVFDENGIPIDFNLSTASNSQIFEQFSTLTDDVNSVPNPSVLLLILIGLGCLSWIHPGNLKVANKPF